MGTHLELEFELRGLDPDMAEAACFEAGALSVTFSSARGEQQAVLEPQPGELRLWPATRVQALFAQPSQPAQPQRAQPARSAQAAQPAPKTPPALIARLATLLGIEPERFAIERLADRIWEREWLRDFHAQRFGERLWICPQHERVDQSGAIVVALDPGLAFGTGTHASTALCLEWLDAAAHRARDAKLHARCVVDYGCGSGILAIAALKLGAGSAHAYDHDPQALLATHENAVRNKVEAQLSIHESAEGLPECDLLIANILAAVLIDLAPRFAALVRGGGRLLLSGILACEEAEVAAAFMKWFDMQQFESRDGWVALAGVRR